MSHATHVLSALYITFQNGPFGHLSPNRPGLQIDTTFIPSLIDEDI
jgi:hypothetical protein